MLAREQAAPSLVRWNAAISIRIGAVLFVAALTGLAGRFAMPLPFTPVPVTLQSVVVLAGAAVLGPWLGALSQVSFLAAGLVGFPVFAESAVLPPGPLRFLGPTAGYLFSFPLAALVTGMLLARSVERGTLRLFLAMTAGLAVIYLVGASWLAAFLLATSGGNTSSLVAAALTRGLYPFVALDLVKLLVAARLLAGVGARRARFVG